MKMKRNLLLAMMLVVAIMLFSGCDRFDVKKWNASCTVYFDMPESFKSLPVAIRESIYYELSLKNTDTNKKTKITVSSKDNYLKKVELTPGKYEVDYSNAGGLSFAGISMNIDTEYIEIKKDSNAEIHIYMENKEQFESNLELRKPVEEIMSSEIFSRKIQCNGQVYDMNTLNQYAVPDGKKNNVGFGDVGFYRIANIPGISLIYKNTDGPGEKYILDCKYIGVRVYSSLTVLPKGLSIGSTIMEFANAQTGILGTPDYCEGSPLVGIGYDDAEFIYLDKNSGDRITIEINADCNYVCAVEYEFERYE